MVLRALSRRAFSDYLLVTNVTLGSGFMFAGDVLAQKLTTPQKEEYHDWNRAKSMCIMGAGFGLLGHYWYSYLDRRFPGKSWYMIRRKIFAECLATPIFAGYTFASFGTLQGKSPAECAEDFCENLPVVCCADWFGYVPLQVINFCYVPPRYRFLFVCGLSVIYDSFLAWLLNQPPPSLEPKKKEENCKEKE